jgi:hypothetical protein
LPVQDPPRKTGQEGELTGYNNGCIGRVSPYHPVNPVVQRVPSVPVQGEGSCDTR